MLLHGLCSGPGRMRMSCHSTPLRQLRCPDKHHWQVSQTPHVDSRSTADKKHGLGTSITKPKTTSVRPVSKTREKSGQSGRLSALSTEMIPAVWGMCVLHLCGQREKTTTTSLSISTQKFEQCCWNTVTDVAMNTRATDP